jgi:hypothetical protein
MLGSKVNQRYFHDPIHFLPHVVRSTERQRFSLV